MTRAPRSIFFKPKDRKLAKIISIKSPAEFRKSLTQLRKGGLTLKEKKALMLARTRAKLQLKRTNLSMNERIEFKKISNIKI